VRYLVVSSDWRGYLVPPSSWVGRLDMAETYTLEEAERMAFREKGREVITFEQGAAVKLADADRLERQAALLREEVARARERLPAEPVEEMATEPVQEEHTSAE